MLRSSCPALADARRHNSTEQIDGIIATIMAIGRAILRCERPSFVYEDRGILML